MTMLVRMISISMRVLPHRGGKTDPQNDEQKQRRYKK